MDDIGSKVAKAVGLLVALILLGVFLRISFKALGLMEKSEARFDSFNRSIDSIEYSNYDNKIISGDSVIAAIRNAENPDPYKLEINVEVAGAASPDVYGYEDNTGDYIAYTETDPTDSDFINPNGRFSSEIDKDSNGVVLRLNFEQVD